MIITIITIITIVSIIIIIEIIIIIIIIVVIIKMKLRGMLQGFDAGTTALGNCVVKSEPRCRIDVIARDFVTTLELFNLFSILFGLPSACF